MAGFTVSVKADTKALLRDLSKVQRRIVPRVTAQALNDTVKEVHRDAISQVAAATNTPRKIWRKRIRRSRLGTIRKNLSAWVFITTEVVLARHLGNPRGGGKGSRVGRHSFPGSFVANMPKSGKRLSMHRKPHSRHKRITPGKWHDLPIEEDRIVVDNKTLAVGARLLAASGARFRRHLNTRLSKALDRK